MLHYDNGAISAVAGTLKILNKEVGVINGPTPAANNRIYRCDMLDSSGVVLFVEAQATETIAINIINCMEVYK
jgi:hypothetical protein